MVSLSNEGIDFNKLQKELNEALDADEKYNCENAAKFRAIEQKVASYEEFRDIVLASNLKPLEKGDKFDGKWNQPWNTMLQTNNPHGHNATGSGNSAKKNTQKPKSTHEFGREWRRLSATEGHERYLYLLYLGPDTLASLFRNEIPFGILGEVLTALCAGYTVTHKDVVVAVLRSLTSARRFSLSVEFLSEAEKQACRELFERVRSGAIIAPSGGDVEESGSVLQSSNCDAQSAGDPIEDKCDERSISVDEGEDAGNSMLKAEVSVDDAHNVHSSEAEETITRSDLEHLMELFHVAKNI